MNAKKLTYTAEEVQQLLDRVNSMPANYYTKEQVDALIKDGVPSHGGDGDCDCLDNASYMSDGEIDELFS